MRRTISNFHILEGAKRIGLLFSAAEIDIQLDPDRIADIEDIENASTVFSDGCGLMTKHFAMQVSKAKRIVFRNQRYTPSVFQIRCVIKELRPAAILTKKNFQVLGL